MKTGIKTGLFFIFLAQVILAQNMEDSVFVLKPVEISAGQIFQKEEAGMKQTKVDSLILLQKINQSLSDLLSENTPVFIKNHGRGALATASFRGTAASHTQVTWNGININTPMAGMVDFSLIPVYIIDDLNLKYGAASIADQGGGLGGSVNISNAVDWNQTINAKYMQGIGSYGTWDEFLQFGIGNRKIQSKSRIYHNYSKNNFTYINHAIGQIDPITGEVINPLDTNDNAAYLRYGFLQELYFRPNDLNVISAKWWWQKADRTIPRATSYEGPDNSNLNDQSDFDNRIVADWKNYGDKHKLSLSTAYTDKHLDYTLKNNVPGLGEVHAIYSQSRQQSYLNKASLNFDLRPDLSFEASAGINYHDVETRDTVQQTGYQQDRSEITIMGAVRKSFGDRLNMNFILRQDWNDGKPAPLVPYFGFDLKLTEEPALILKGNIAKNYHQPSLNDLYWQPGGNPDLLPEEGFSGESGITYSGKLWSQKFSTGFTVFRSDINNWIIWVPSYKGFWEPRNVKRVVSQGLEISASMSGQIKRMAYKIAANYAYTDARNYGDPLVWGDESYGKQLVYIPLHSGNLMLNFSWKRFYFTWQHNSYSERFTTSSNDISRRDWLYPYFMNDVIIGKEFRMDKITLSAEIKVYNLFDETYHSALYRPMPGRNYLFMVMIRY